MFKNYDVLCALACLLPMTSCTSPVKPDAMETSAPSLVAVESAEADHALAFLSASELAEKIRTRKVSSTTVVQIYLNRLDAYNGKLNAVVTINRENALQRAKEADEALERGEIWGPLHGVPVTIKDNIATRGIRTTSSLPKLSNFVPDVDATVVKRLKNAGAIILGKTNLPLLACDFQTRSPIFGVTNNPWDLTRTPGGSTGGGAAAVAAGLTPLEIGNDMAGSVRIPAHFCGIYSLKPTEHRVPTTGMSPEMTGKNFRSSRHLLAFGPLARSIDDLELCLSLLSGPDGKDPDVPDVPLTNSPSKDLKDLRIAWSDDFGGIPVSKETKDALKRLTDSLANAGCTVTKINPAGFDFNDAWITYGQLNDLQFGVNIPSIARFFLYFLGRSKRKNTPTHTMVFPMTYEKYLTALTNRENLMMAMDRFLSDYDVFLCPVHTTAAYKHIQKDRHIGPLSMYTKDVTVEGKKLSYWMANGAYTTIFNLTGNPVVILPVTKTTDNLPFGIQVVGSRWHDMELLNIAKQLDTLCKGYQIPPGY